jgi:hypothetical protein
MACGHPRRITDNAPVSSVSVSGGPADISTLSQGSYPRPRTVPRPHRGYPACLLEPAVRLPSNVVAKLCRTKRSSPRRDHDAPR